VPGNFRSSDVSVVAVVDDDDDDNDDDNNNNNNICLSLHSLLHLSLSHSIMSHNMATWSDSAKFPTSLKLANLSSFLYFSSFILSLFDLIHKRTSKRQRCWALTAGQMEVQLRVSLQSRTQYQS
jgi:hypothetical protein